MSSKYIRIVRIMTELEKVQLQRAFRKRLPIVWQNKEYLIDAFSQDGSRMRIIILDPRIKRIMGKIAKTRFRPLPPKTDFGKFGKTFFCVGCNEIRPEKGQVYGSIGTLAAPEHYCKRCSCCLDVVPYRGKFEAASATIGKKKIQISEEE